MKNMILKELVIENDVDNVYAISLVKNPAIQENFMHFKKMMKFKDEPLYFYALRPEFVGDELIIDTSHNLCKSFAHGESIAYTEEEVRSWSKYANDEGWGMEPDAPTWFSNFPKEGVNLPMYGCRHHLKKKQMFHSNFSTTINFEMSTKPRRIVGPVMVANKPMLRPAEEMDGVNMGYVWYSNDTLQSYYERFGKKSNATLLHELDISDYLILMKSWIDKTDSAQHKWMAEYYVLSDFIWQQILDGDVAGFSVEMVASMK